VGWADCDVAKRENIQGPFNIVFEYNFHHFHIKNTHLGLCLGFLSSKISAKG
jgi:hypothetical protein